MACQQCYVSDYFDTEFEPGFYAYFKDVETYMRYISAALSLLSGYLILRYPKLQTHPFKIIGFMLILDAANYLQFQSAEHICSVEPDYQEWQEYIPYSEIFAWSLFQKQYPKS